MIAAIESGRDLIVSDRHRAAALRLAWARHQRRKGLQVWSTPRIHTWEAWLTRCWREASLQGAVPAAQLLSASQERALWEQVLERMSALQPDEPALTLHAAALMSAAARATQAQLVPGRLAQSREELLLPAALAEVRSTCAARGLLSLRLAPAESLAFLAGFPAPLIVGEPRLTALQETLARRHWPDVPLLLALPDPAPAPPTLLRATDLQQELAACAAWCVQQVQRDAGTRLLVLTACSEPSPRIQGELLWQELVAAGVRPDGQARQRWLAVEGGEPLLHQALIADALLALELAGGSEAIETTDLLRLLRSPYFDFGGTGAADQLADWLGQKGLASYPRHALQAALRAAADRAPAAQLLATWMGTLQGAGGTRAAADWAARLTTTLEAARFARAAPLDSREQQRLLRWHALLDELASLDAVLPPLSLADALARLRRLALQTRHGAASADAAITFSEAHADPVAGYGGIWVLGLTESRWPAAPRPDAWIALAEQRRALWPEASVRERRERAQWALACWRQRAAELVLSYPEREADLAHRPTTLVPAGEGWKPVMIGASRAAATGQSRVGVDQQLPAMPAPGAVRALAGGARRLDTHQDCPFRAQAEWRLGAVAPARLSDGIPYSLRGRLLHSLLQELWRELGAQAQLLALDSSAEQALLERCWNSALQASPDARWLGAAVLERERRRALRTAAAVLVLERGRAPFRVRERELSLRWEGAGAALSLRIDRIDQVGEAAVLIDYKSGGVPRIDLQQGTLQPLQLAVYATALAQQDRPVSAAALLQLTPAGPAFSGVTAEAGLLPGALKPVGDWPQTARQWQAGLVELMSRHLAGEATLARDRAPCRHCHLPALCRRAGSDAPEAEAAMEAGDE